MDTQLEAKRNASSLPVEILLQICRECMEPYSLRIYQPLHPSLSFTSSEGVVHQDISVNTVTLVVDGLTVNGRVQHLTVLPDIANLKLVNKMFPNEIRSALSAKFSGRLDIEKWVGCLEQETPATWTQRSQERNSKNFFWIIPLITHVSIATLEEAYQTLDKIEQDLFPNVQEVKIHVPPVHSISASEAEISSGMLDSQIGHGMLRHMRSFLDRWFDVVTIQSRGCKLLVVSKVIFWYSATQTMSYSFTAESEAYKQFAIISRQKEE